MKTPRPLLFLAAVLALLGWQMMCTDGSYDAWASVPVSEDSLLIVRNNIHYVRAVSEREVNRDERRMYSLGDTLVYEHEQLVTWTEYDRKGRIVAVRDTFTASDQEAMKISGHLWMYNGDTCVREIRTEWEVTPGKGRKPEKKEVVRNEVTEFQPLLVHKTTGFMDGDRWSEQTEITTLNGTGQKTMVCTHNTSGDSFVEQFVYDAQARLSYRRLAMKRSWSPPWEMESTTYTYRADGSKMLIDSVWRINPDVSKANPRSWKGRRPSIVPWLRLLAISYTGTFDKLWTRKETTFDPQGRLILSQLWEEYASMWEDYTWTYDSAGNLIRRTEWRGDKPGDHSVYGKPCLDSVWYEYKDGMLYSKHLWNTCNGYENNYRDTFGLNGVAYDGNGTITRPYNGPLANGVAEKLIYELGYHMETNVIDVNGLVLQRTYTSIYKDYDKVSYTYFKW